MSITLRQLEIFIAVAETAQVTKASKKLFVTQSAVSMALAELENQLGGSLFDRHGRSLLLNARGRFLLPLAKDITCQVTNIETIMSERNDTLDGTINIVASTTLGNYILPYLIGAFERVHPNVHVNLLVYNTRYAEQLVLEKQSEVGFVEGPLTKNDEMQWRPWFEDELIVLCGPTDPLAHNETFDITRDLKGKKWIMRETGSGTVATIREKFGKYMDDVNIVMEMGHPEAVKRGVESGVGITCLSSLSICREAENGWLKGLKIDGLDMKRQLKIIQRTDLEISDAMAEFLSFCDVMSICDDSRVCLSSPWKLQSLLARHSAQKK
ncbi:LysR substrate-binding domain-containing protein [Desulforhopalus sp. IMCC35007]|uniref:LysR substrate-binding domain-containing protein n=1 Tax=Desulforhopalus sp. IMCC35007 TaxID=2569543 RepID=UPI0010AE2BAD|nr:LysR substrate-binding domain-containing protein [Desulforhopalus sp. IMCC35007]TKB08034.1 LysR family transcriptional regulator [Desulforhopalus sp. IMCC35007]